MRRMELIIALLAVIVLTPITKDDIYLIGQVATAEAGNQCILGQRYVIDTILNRVDSDKFPDTVYKVVNAPNQYTKARPEPSEEMLKIVQEEVDNRINTKVVFFQRAGYFDRTKPVTKIQAHYFSGLLEDEEGDEE